MAQAKEDQIKKMFQSETGVSADLVEELLTDTHVGMSATIHTKDRTFYCKLTYGGRAKKGSFEEDTAKGIIKYPLSEGHQKAARRFISSTLAIANIPHEAISPETLNFLKNDLRPIYADQQENEHIYNIRNIDDADEGEYPEMNEAISNELQAIIAELNEGDFAYARISFF